MEISKLIKSDSQNIVIPQNKGTIKGICVSLNRSAEEYDPQKTIHSIEKYLKNEERILYSEVSGYVFTLNEEEKGNFLSNVELLLVSSIGSEKMERNVRQCILKLYDHVHLALYQEENLKSDTDELKSVIAKNLEPVKERFEQRIQDTYKELYVQLIALIGIFTAMAFLVFGSITALDNIFAGAREMSIFKIVIIACIWGVCVLNLVFIFIVFVARMTGLNETNGKKIKYPIVAWSNLVIITILLFSAWEYYVRSMGLTEWFKRIALSNDVVITILGFSVILLIFIFSAIGLIYSTKEEKRL